MENDKRLEELLSSNTITQKTYEKATITKNYIERVLWEQSLCRQNVKILSNASFLRAYF